MKKEPRGRVLLVDDEEGILTTLGAYLRRDGYEVQTATDPETAQASLAASPFDALVTDLCLIPGRPDTGLGLVQHARETQPALATLLFTGYLTVETEAEAYALGTNRVVPKERGLAEVVRVLDELLAASKATREKREKQGRSAGPRAPRASRPRATKARREDSVGEGADETLSARELEQLLAVYLAEADEALGVMESGLLRIEAEPDHAESLAAVFRAAHTIKGSAGAFGLTAVAVLSHTLEDLLADMRDGRIVATGGRITLLLTAVDALRELLARGQVAKLEGPYRDLQRRIVAARRGDGGSPSPVPDVPRPEAPAGASGPALARTLRIDVDRLDQLLSLVGEIAVSRARMAQMIATPGVSRRSIQEGERESERLYLDLQDLVMKLRMVPVGPAFQQLARPVRDLAQALGKEARLETSGGDVEVDNTVLQLLRDPLTHMVRNALDHGIESPEARLRAGKPRDGRVTLRSHREPSGIVIELSDDGSGIDRERLLTRARERGLVAADATPPDSQLFPLLFEAGLSTAARVSDVSGRGVGLDVVRRNIHALRGSVAVDSRAGEGTTITIRLPLTLAIIEGLLLRVGEEVYVVPVEEVSESLALPAEAAGEDAPAGVVGLRGRALPFVRLRHRLMAEGPHPEREVLVIVGDSDGAAGLVADAVIGQGQFVIKPLSKIFQRARGLSATTVLGDGRVALILDTPALLETDPSSGAQEGERPAESGAALG